MTYLEIILLVPAAGFVLSILRLTIKVRRLQKILNLKDAAYTVDIFCIDRKFGDLKLSMEELGVKLDNTLRKFSETKTSIDQCHAAIKVFTAEREKTKTRKKYGGSLGKITP